MPRARGMRKGGPEAALSEVLLSVESVRRVA